MATVAIPRTGTTGKARTVLRSITAAAARVLSPHKASVKRLAEMPLTVLGTASIDFAAFHVAHSLGWLVTGASLYLVEHMIADDDEPGRM